MKHVKLLLILSALLMLVTSCARSPGVQEPSTAGGTEATPATGETTKEPTKEKTTMNVMSFNVLGMNRETETANSPKKQWMPQLRRAERSSISCWLASRSTLPAFRS